MDDPHARHGVVIDMRNAVLMDTIDVSAVEPYTDGQPHDVALALSLGGRINKTRERASRLYSSPSVTNVNGVSSNSVRPTMSAPAMSINRAEVVRAHLREPHGQLGPAVWTSTSPLPYHLNGLSNPDSPGPAM
jgi:hypothetical protein